MLSRHSIRPIQTSQLLESMKRGPCLIVFLIFSPTELSCFHYVFRVPSFIFYFTVVKPSIYTSGSVLSTNLDISLITPSTSNSQTDTSLITPCCLSIAAAITPEASWVTT